MELRERLGLEEILQQYSDIISCERVLSCEDHWSLSAVTHAPFHASVLMPASQGGPMHKTAGMGKLVNHSLLRQEAAQ